MKLLTKKIRATLPKLRAQENAADPTAHIKFFTPDSSFTWYVTEGEARGNDFLFFGYCLGLEAEWGYFALSELESGRGLFGLPVERDLYFEPTPMSEIIRQAEALDRFREAA